MSPSTTSAPERSIAVGDFELVSLWDGTLTTSAETIIGLDTAQVRALLDEATRISGHDPLVLPVRAFLIRSAGHLVLIDTGSGSTKGPTMGFLPQSLARAGARLEDIDTVLLTHLHMDHIGGLLDRDGQRAFPNAELVMHQREASYYLDTDESRIDQRARRNIAFQRRAIAAYGERVRRIEDGEAIAGISAHLTAGHSPGHVMWRISSGGASAIVIGDVVHMAAIQLALPDTAMIYDTDPDMARATRWRVLSEAARSGEFVAGAHLPAAGLGTIVGSGSGFAFEPAETTAVR